jgi:predicted RNA binding protein YcfA (HicA-like mRNA interferase family)
VKQVSGKQFISIIRRKGWVLTRISGSHHIFVKSGRSERIVVPVHGNTPLKVGLLKSLMKIAELSPEDL